MTRETKAERQAEAGRCKEKLSEWLYPNRKLYWTASHKTRTGNKSIKFLLVEPKQDGEHEIFDISYYVARFFGWKLDHVHGGILNSDPNSTAHYLTAKIVKPKFVAPGFQAVNTSVQLCLWSI